MSSYVDEDTAQAIDSGRETALEALASVQYEAKKVFVVFTVFFLATVLALRFWIWEWLESLTRSRMAEAVAREYVIIAVTPFDVILMQIKVGLIIGGLAGAIFALYLARKKIVARVEEKIEVTAPRLYLFALVVACLAVGGMVYAYQVFFPLMFMVLAEQAYAAGAVPRYDIVAFTQFLLLLTLSFGLAAQLPLLMGLLSYAEVVPYETFRDKWRYAVVGIFVFGAVFSPPDPFTQILWAIPLTVLYGFSLGLSKLVTNVHRAGEHSTEIEAGTFRRKALSVAGGAGLAFVGTVAALATGVAVPIGEAVLRALPNAIEVTGVGTYSLPSEVVLGEPLDWVLAGIRAALVVGGLFLVYHLIDVLRMPVVPRQQVASAGAPEELDLRVLDVEGVRAAPPEAFATLSEDEALEIAGEAMEAGRDEKGKFLLQRWEEVDAEGVAPSGGGSAPDVDLAGASVEEVRDAPLGAFAAYSEDDIVEIAGSAMETGEEERGQLLLERWQQAEEADLEVDAGSEPADLDVASADVETIREAPVEAFVDMTEDEAIDLAGEAMEAGDDEKGTAILQRWEEADGVEVEDDEAAGDANDDEEEDVWEEGLLAGTTAGIFDAFSGEEREEDEIGGYIYDIGFILDSLRSELFVVFGTFMAVFVGTFAYLYTVGIQDIMGTFVSAVPSGQFSGGLEATTARDVLIARHPVEVLIFIVKFSGVVAFLVTLPLLLYYLWPKLQERSLAPGSGSQRGFLLWGGVVIATTLFGAAIGFFEFAPRIVSWLVWDAAQNGMVISYRIKSLLWVIFFMTIGFGLLFNVPMGMIVLHVMDLVTFDTFRRWWRQVVLGIFVVAMVLVPGGVLLMVIFAIPLTLAYLFGLGVLWVGVAPWSLAREIQTRLPDVRR